MGTVNHEIFADNRRMQVVKWLKSLFPDLKLALDASDEDLREQLFDGVVLCAIVSRKNLDSIQSQRGALILSDQRVDNLKRFLSAVDNMGLPKFDLSDLEEGSMLAVVNCLLSLRDHMISFKGEDGIDDAIKCGMQPRKKWNLVEGYKDKTSDASDGNIKFDQLTTSKGQKYDDVFQLKQARYCDLPVAQISEMMKSNGLDNAPTRSLLSFVNGMLDESIDRVNGEIPHRAACLLRKVVQEIERRISTQAEHIRNQNNVIKAREERYQSRIRVLETLASGRGEESQIVSNQLQKVKEEKTKIEEIKKYSDRDFEKLAREKEKSDRIIFELNQELENSKISHQNHCHQLETNANEIKTQLEAKLKDMESLLVESRKRTKELETFSESKFQNWNKKEHVFQKFIGFQLQSVKNVRVASESIKQEVVKIQNGWKEEMSNLGVKLKVLVDAAENSNTILAENRKLYNEVLELKGNIRVYCRVRPFLPGQNGKSTTVDYIGDDGEIVVINPSKQAKDGRRLFKFNKTFGPASTQEQVYLDVQPLVRSVLDGFNVCIFAYGQTGSGKTYTMNGPQSTNKEEWGVNYRALNDLFNISRSRSSTFLYDISIQMVEIYNEQVRDLLNNNVSQKRLGIMNSSQPNGLAVPDASILPVKSTSDVIETMQFGHSNRAMSSTALNERSSRSHSVVTIHVRGVDLKSGSTTRGCLHLIDLAGSERVDRSEVTGDRLKEAQHINKSLSALGDVIFALARKSSHVPYRNSKLTQVLQSSLGGHAKTLMFVQVNPDVESYSETISTLKFAERVSGVELGAARSSKEGKDVRDLMEQVASLKDTIAKKDEEIEELQLLKDLKGGSANGFNSLRHSLSSPDEISTRKINVGTVPRFTEKFALDPEIRSESSDKFSEDGSQQSLDDVSDISDGTEISIADSNLSESSKNMETPKAKMSKASRAPRSQLQKTMSVRKESVRSPVPRTNSTSMRGTASAKRS